MKIMVKTKKIIIFALMSLSLSAFVLLIGLSYLYSVMIIVAALVFMILIILGMVYEEFKNKFQAQPSGKIIISRTYNQYGEIVESRHIQPMGAGYWVTTITRSNGDFLVEHSRTGDNLLNNCNSMLKDEEEYNRNIVFGQRYGRKRFAQRIENKRDSGFLPRLYGNKNV